jgi:hypothetical protein
VPDTAAPDTATPKTVARRSRAAQFAVLAVRVALVLVAGRLLLAVIVPFAVERVAAAYGFDVEWTSFRVHYLRGALDIEGLSVAVRPASVEVASEPWLRVESVHADLALRDLLSADLRVQRAAAVGVDVVAERRADGEIPVLAALRAAVAEEQPAAKSRPQPLHFDPPLRIDALRVESLRLDVRDEVSWPGRAWRVEADVRGDDLGYPDRRGRIAVRASGADFVDMLRVETEIETRADDAVASVRARVVGLRASAIAPWLAEIGGVPGLAADATVGQVSADARVDAHVRTAGSARDGLAGSVRVTGLNVTADGVGVARLANAVIEVTAVRSTELHVGGVEVDTGELAVRRNAEGQPCALGFVLRDDTQPASSTAPPGAALAATSTATSGAARPDPLAFRVAVDAVQLHAVALAVRDEVFEPASVLRAELERGSVTGLDTRAAGDQPVRIDLEGSLAGLASQFRAHGVLSPFAEHKRVEIELEASGIRPTALEPHLRELGLESTFQDGSLTARILGSGRATADGGVEGEVKLADVALADGAQLFGVRAVEAFGIAIEPATRRLRVRDLTVHGTNLPLRRAADGSFAAFGLHTVKAESSRRVPTSGSAASSVASPRPPATPEVLPRVEIDRLAVVENRLSWRDETLAQPVDVVFDDCGVEVTGLALFGDPTRHAETTARLKIWSHAKELVKEVAVSGTITTQPGPLKLELDVEGSASGITAVRLRPYIDPTGLEERLEEASISGGLVLSLAQETDGLRASVEVRDFAFQSSETSFTGVKLVRVKDAVLSPERIEVASIEVEDGRLQVARDPLGALLALGLRIPLSLFRSAGAVDPQSPAEADRSQAEQFLANLPDVRVGSVRVTNASLAWRDQGFTPPLETSARFDAHAERLSTRATEDASYAVTIAITDTVEEIHVEGTARVRPGTANMTMQCRARGLRAGTLATYLPAGVVCELEAGEIDANGAISVSQHEAGGLRGSVEGRGRLGEADSAEPLLKLEDFELVLGRADTAKEEFEIERVIARGLECDVHRDAQGRLHALGFAIGAASDVSPKTAADAAPLAPDARQDPLAHSFPDLTPPGSPRVVLGDVDLEMRQLTFRDEARGTAPIELAGRVRTPGRQVLVDAEPAALPPFTATIEASVVPLVRYVDASLAISPWAEEPSLSASFTANGISGAGLDAIGRDLSTWIDGTQLTDGVASGSIAAKFRWKRRSPLDLDLRAGFAADVELGRLEFRDAPDGNVLAALDGGEADIARVDLATGSVHVKALELRQPEMRAQRTADGGFEVLGLVVHPERRPLVALDAAHAPLVALETASDARRESTGTALDSPPVVIDASAAPRARARGEVRIDELLVRGIDVELRDAAATPATVLPLVDLDVLVQRLTTRAFEEPRVIRFDAWLGAGEAELPRTADSASGLPGDQPSPGLEKRRVFQEAVLTGRIQFVPEITGHAQATLSGLELMGLAGTAHLEGVDIHDGTFDASVRMRFRGQKGVRVDSELVFSDLSMSEAENGPLATYLTLPMPLDTVLFLLKDEDGEHHIPVSFTLGEDGLTTAKIAAAATGAAASVLVSAIAAAPVRVLSTFTDLFGITGGEEDPPPNAQLGFAPGTVALDTESRAALEPLARKMRADRDFIVQVQHRFGAADIERAERLANPPPEDCRQFVDGLRRRRAELARERAELAADVRAAWGSGQRAAAEAQIESLRLLDAESGKVEDALDKVLELLAPGAERHRGKRTRAAALAVARQRIESLRAWFAAQKIPDFEERFEAKSPAFDVISEDQPGSILAVLRERH